jgi:hypothetical protein
MGWPKGKPRAATGVGRKVGSTNKRNEGIEEFSRRLVEDPEYQTRLVQRAKQGSLAPGMETMFFHYAYGKPREHPSDDQAFLEDLFTVVLKHAGTAEAQQEIRDVIEAHTRPARLSIVA